MTQDLQEAANSIVEALQDIERDDQLRIMASAAVLLGDTELAETLIANLKNRCKLKSPANP